MDGAFLAELADRIAIQDSIARYARAVDRSDWDGIRAEYHSDASDDHGEYKGDLDGLIAYLQELLGPSINGMHFLGNCLIEFIGEGVALVETYFISQRLRPPTTEDQGWASGDAICRLGWGRYIDRYELRDGVWKVAMRQVVMDAIFSTVAKGGGERKGRTAWGLRNQADPLFALRMQMTEGRR